MNKLEANLGPKKSKVLKIKIRSAQIVGEVFFMPEKSVPTPFGALPAHFFRGPEKSKNCSNFAYFPWWAHGPYSPGLGLEGMHKLLPKSGTVIGPSAVQLRRVYNLSFAITVPHS